MRALSTEGDVYRAGRDTERDILERGREHYPKTSIASQAIGDVASDAVLRFLGVPGVGTMPYNVGMGALTGLLSSDAELTPDKATETSVAQNLAGAGLGAYAGKYGTHAGEVLGKGAAYGAGLIGRGLQRLGTGVIEPTAAARYLQSLGVDNLTVGQMAPRSFLAQMEEASTSTAGIGPSIKAQREAALGDVQQAALREVLPPAPVVPGGRNLGEQIASIKSGFRAAYDIAKGHEISPDNIRKALDAVDDPGIYADSALRTKVGGWLKNQMTAVRLSGPNGGALSDDVIQLRSNVRDLITETANTEERALLRAAEDELTGALDAGLPPNVQQALRETDRQYAKFRSVADANWSAKDSPRGFTHGQLSSAVRSNTPRRLYEEGGGGPLRDLSAAATETLEAQIPLTGARWLSVGPVPYITGPMSYTANLPGPKRALLGQTDIQRSIAGADWLDDLARTNPEALGRFGAYLGAAASRSPEALSVAKYELGQLDPEYQEERRRQGGQQQ
jgi:hypothetical protein